MSKSEWTKRGKIFKTNGNFDWMNSHTTPISAIDLKDRIRIYFSTRSKIDLQGNYISNSSFIDVDRTNPRIILNINDHPLFDLGDFGMFDEFGVMVTDVIEYKGKIYLYYAGWQRLGGGTASYQVMLGLGISIDGGYSFKKVSNGPIMGIDTFDPISIGNVAVITDKQLFKLYYTSLTKWFINGTKPTYDYIINYAESEDGIVWDKKKVTAISMENGFGVATPSVIKLEDGYHMWFGYRKTYDPKMKVGGYKIGYANSSDGINWNRKDSDSSISPSKEGWDSEMVCYPSVLKINDKLLMFYCGNEFGKEGFGYAEKSIKS